MKPLDYHECKPRGTFDFPIEYYHIDASHPRYAMPYHWHVEFELLRVLQGSFQLVLNNATYTLLSGDAAFIRDGALHGGTPDNCVYECLVFDLSAFLKGSTVCKMQLKPILDHDIYVDEVYPAGTADISPLIDRLFEAMGRKERGWALYTQGTLYQLFGAILKNGCCSDRPGGAMQNKRRVRQLKRVIERIETDYAAPLTLSELAAHSGMSDKYFCKFFREMTHRTPIDYLNYYRIECACEQLRTTGDSVTDIAYRCGFNDLSYFIKTFRHYKGTTPKSYRKQG